jgi:hypothetical protein
MSQFDAEDNLIEFDGSAEHGSADCLISLRLI